MNDILNPTTSTANDTTVSDAPALISLTDWAASTDQDDAPSSLVG